jgi:hypothetical protein
MKPDGPWPTASVGRSWLAAFGSRLAAVSTSVFVGRAGEVSLLRGLVAVLMGGLGGVVLVEGEPGSGSRRCWRRGWEMRPGQGVGWRGLDQAVDLVWAGGGLGSAGLHLGRPGRAGAVPVDRDVAAHPDQPAAG